MRISISSVKQHSLVPAIALLAAVLILTGQTFNCCHLNQIVAGQIASAWSQLLPSRHDMVSMAGTVGPMSTRLSGETGMHAHCHGHGFSDATSHYQAGRADFQSGSLDAFGTCLSERVENGKPMLAGDFAFSAVSGFHLPIPIGDAPVPTLRPESPRPQNRSSPPLYLITLRILV